MVLRIAETTRRTLLRHLLCALASLLIIAAGCGGEGEPAGNDGSPEDNGSGEDAIYTETNIYLDKVVEWNPQPAGSARGNTAGIIDKNLMPILNDRAIGPPEGIGSYSRGDDCLAVGINGSAAFRFQEGFYIYNGPGDDFITFEGSFAWGGAVDGLCCELAHVEVSEDLETWYYNSAEAYDVNPDPSEDSDAYQYYNVQGLHGNNPTWANHTEDVQAQQIVDGFWVDIPDTFVSKDFRPWDPYLGGDGFDLDTFRSKQDDSPWPEDGKMKYVRIIDDDTILDGQDWAKPWSLGAQMQSALGIHVKKEGN